MADTRTETFDNVFVGKATGTLKLNASGLAWKASSSAGKTITHRREEIRSLSSARSVRGFQVRIILPNGASLKLDGFSKEGLDLLRKYIKDAYDKEIEKREFNLKGIHWGDLEVKDSVLMFGSGSKPTMEIPLSEIENAILSSKNDISIELTVDTEVANDDVIVTEMQFHIDDVKRKNRDDEEDQTEEATAAEALHKRIKASTGRGLETQTPVASFEDLNCSHPSGRFKIDLFEKLFWIHSAANDYKLLYSNIQRIFLLPKDEDKSYVVIALNTSIRQGQTLYQYLIFNFENTDELKISISLSEQDIATKYSGKLRKEYDGAAFQVVTEILSGISGKTVTTPGDQPFRNNYAQNFVQCSVKTNRGSLYPLRKAFFFVGKIPHYIGYSTVKKVEFTGLELNSTIFDMRVTIRADESDDTTLVFSQLNRSTLKELEEFLQSRDIRVKKVTPVAAPVKKMELDDGGDEDEDEDSPDEDFAPAEDSDIEEEYDEGSGAENAPSSEPKKDKDKGKEKEKAVEKEKSKEKPKTHEKDSGKDKKRSRDEDEEEEEEQEEEEEDDDDDEDKAKQSKSKKKASKHDAEDEEEEEDEDEDEEEEKPKKKDKEKEKEKDKKKDSHKDKDKKKEKESSSSSSKSSKKSKDDDKPKKRAKKDKDAPKRALTGFIIFSTEKRKTLKGKTIGEQGKELGEMWKKISPEEKKEWEEKSKKDKERYEREMKAYKEKKKNEE